MYVAILRSLICGYLRNLRIANIDSVCSVPLWLIKQSS